MNKPWLSAILLLLLCPVTFATDNIQTLSTAPAALSPGGAAAPLPAPAPAPSPTASPPPPINKSNVAPVSNESNATQAKPAPAINCNYHISADTPKVDQSIVTLWAENAAMQAFDLNHAEIDMQLSALKACFTDAGWQGFNTALLQSGNINAIKSQNLTVNGQMDGDLSITSNKEGLWKVTIPMQVVYQNDKERLTQQLTIDLLIGRKPSGDLGIMQMIAIPRGSAPQAMPAQ